MRSRHLATPAAALALSLLTACGGGEQEAPTAQETTPTATTSPIPSPTPTPTPPTPAEEAETALANAMAGDITVPESAGGRTDPVDLPGEDSGRDGPVWRYTVEVEEGLDDVALGFGYEVRTALTGDKGWESVDGIHFVHLTPEEQRAGEEPDFRILFASPELVDQECLPARTLGRLSCHNAGKVMVNAWRWVNGAETFGDDLATYRTYLINHEVGHAIGHGHTPCPAAGEKAPVMLQQTLRLDGCEPYPYPAR